MISLADITECAIGMKDIDYSINEKEFCRIGSDETHHRCEVYK